MTAFTSTGNLILAGKFTKPADLSTPTDALTVNISTEFIFANGTGANQCNFQWSDTRTVAASSNDDIDLSGGITDAFGTTIAATSIKMMYIRNRGTGPLQIGGATDPFSSWLADPTDAVILPGGTIMLLLNPSAAGYVVTAGSADVLRVRATAGSPASIQYDIVLWGVRS
jgi:hypothetical protein